jgi:hypothetical protein
MHHTFNETTINLILTDFCLFDPHLDARYPKVSLSQIRIRTMKFAVFSDPYTIFVFFRSSRNRLEAINYYQLLWFYLIILKNIPKLWMMWIVMWKFIPPKRILYFSTNISIN